MAVAEQEQEPLERIHAAYDVQIKAEQEVEHRKRVLADSKKARLDALTDAKTQVKEAIEGSKGVPKNQQSSRLQAIVALNDEWDATALEHDGEVKAAKEELDVAKKALSDAEARFKEVMEGSKQGALFD